MVIRVGRCSRSCVRASAQAATGRHIGSQPYAALIRFWCWKEIVERGTHGALLAADGRYRQLYDKQYKFERDQFINPGEDFTPTPAQPFDRTSTRPSNL